MGKLKKKALITGITGQDGSYLAELLLKKNYKVIGLIKKKNHKNKLKNISHIKSKIKLYTCDLENYLNIKKKLTKIKPNEIYHLAAESFVSYNFEEESKALNINIKTTHNILSIIKNYLPKTKFYFASSSEMYSKINSSPQNELTNFKPGSAYGVSKLAGFQLTRNFRETYGIFACTGILYNHESPRRGINFVTRKITNSVAKIKLGKQKKLILGNLSSKRDWGYAPDYVEAIWLMMQSKIPSDYVIGTGKLHTVKDLLKIAFSHVGLNYKKFVKISKKFYRPTDAIILRANSKKALNELGWKPKTNFKKIIKLMVDADLKKLKN